MFRAALRGGRAEHFPRQAKATFPRVLGRRREERSYRGRAARRPGCTARKRDGERPVGELVDRLGISQPGVSKHLRVLREAGLVAVRPSGRRLYGLRAAPLAEVDAWLAPYREHWSGRLAHPADLRSRLHRARAGSRPRLGLALPLRPPGGPPRGTAASRRRSGGARRSQRCYAERFGLDREVGRRVLAEHYGTRSASD